MPAGSPLSGVRGVGLGESGDPVVKRSLTWAQTGRVSTAALLFQVDPSGGWPHRGRGPPRSPGTCAPLAPPPRAAPPPPTRCQEGTQGSAGPPGGAWGLSDSLWAVEV